MMLRAASESALSADGEASPPLTVSFLLADFCHRGGLDDVTASIVAELAFAQQQRDDDEEEAVGHDADAVEAADYEGWNSVGVLLEQSGFDYFTEWESQEPDAAEERRQSRMADERLGRDGQPVRLPMFAPLERGFAATPSIGHLQPKDVRVGTFGASRAEADGEGARRTANQLRFRPPGPGSFTPELDVPPTYSPNAYRLQNGRGFSQGARWSKDDRWKHLGRINYTNHTSAVPMTCGARRQCPACCSTRTFPTPTPAPTRRERPLLPHCLARH